jgi:hypothetical protein
MGPGLGPWPGRKIRQAGLGKECAYLCVSPAKAEAPHNLKNNEKAMAR